MEGPLSSYSCFEIHICWKVESEAKMEPPIQTEYFRSGGAMILTFIEEGARAVISFCIRSEIPGYIVVPPDYTSISSSQLLDVPKAHHNNIAVKIFSDIDIAFHDGIEGCDVDTTALKTQDTGLE